MGAVGAGCLCRSTGARGSFRRWCTFSSPCPAQLGSFGLQTLGGTENKKRRGPGQLGSRIWFPVKVQATMSKLSRCSTRLVQETETRPAYGYCSGLRLLFSLPRHTADGHGSLGMALTLTPSCPFFSPTIHRSSHAEAPRKPPPILAASPGGDPLAALEVHTQQQRKA